MSISTFDEASIQLPKWKCHKEVWADEIVDITFTPSGSRWHLSCGGIVDANTVREITQRSSPIVGDYFVEYEDGYRSWSPVKAFIDGYERIV